MKRTLRFIGYIALMATLLGCLGYLAWGIALVGCIVYEARYE
jgi:hypothetical protein